MIGRNNRLRFMLLGIGGLGAVLSLTGCAVLSNLGGSKNEDKVVQSGSNNNYSVNGTSVNSNTGASVSESFQKTYTAVKVQTLRVRDEMGAIEIKPAEDGKDEIRIEATKTVQGGNLSEVDLKKLLPKVKISAHLDGDALVVEAEHDTDGFPNNASANVAFVIAVPKRLALDLRTDNSPINATGSEGGVTLRTSNGAIELSQLAGAVDAQTSNGLIRLTDAKAQKSIKLVTTNGLIACEEIQAASPTLDVTLETENGQVEYAGDVTNATLHSSNGGVTFEPTTFGLAKADLQTDNSSITVNMPSALSATIDAETSNGHIYLDGITDPSNPNAGSDVTTRHIVLNEGKAAITAHTSNGSITLASH